MPIVLVVIYYSFIATGMYVSETQFSLRSPEGNGSTEWMALFGQAASGTGADAYVILHYIESSALVERLDSQLNLKKHYHNAGADFFSRMKEDASQEEFVAYVQKHISVNYDQTSGILRLKVRAFTPEYAQAFCRAILAQSEELVNKLRDRGVEDSLQLTREEVARAEARLGAARQKLTAFRQNNDLLDPRIQAGAVQGVIGKLEASAAQAKTELAEARTYMRDDSPKVISLKARINALDQQIRKERIRLTGKRPEAVSSLASEYEALTVEHEFAQKQYLSALTSLEAARIRTESQSRYLVAFIQPTMPEKALWPRRFYSITIYSAIILVFYSLGSLIVAAVREHAGV